MTHAEFIDLVQKMRETQKAYFRARRTQAGSVADKLLAESKALERQVDDEIKNFKSAGQPVQAELFQ